MSFRFTHFWPLLTPLLLLACGGSGVDASQQSTGAPSPSKLLKSLNRGGSWSGVGQVAAGSGLSIIDLNPQPVLLTLRTGATGRSMDDGATYRVTAHSSRRLGKFPPSRAGPASTR